HLFSFLINENPTKPIKKKYHLTGSFFPDKGIKKNNEKAEFIHSGPYETIKYAIKIEENPEIKKTENTTDQHSNYGWRVWNCGEKNETIKNPIEIPSQNLVIKYQLINKSETKRKKTENYLL